MPYRASIKRKLNMTYVAIVFVTVLIFELLFTAGLYGYYYNNIESTLMDRMMITVDVYESYLDYRSLGSKAKFILENAAVPDYVDGQVIDLSGNIIESTARFSSDDKVATQDYKNALIGVTSMWMGKHPVTGERVMAVSAPLYESDVIMGVIRYITSVEEVDLTIKTFMMYAYLIGAGVIITIVVLSRLMARGIIEPIYELKAVADNIALGNYDIKARKYNDDEIGELAETINYMSEEIVKTERLKHDFISSISHELRTPLTSIKGWSETILTGDFDNKEETQLGLEIISKETERLHSLVENLLDFSKLEANRIQMDESRFNFVDLVERVFLQFKTLMKDQGLSHQVSVPKRDITFYGDRNRLKQVLINIVDNAIKHTPAGGLIMCQMTIQEDVLIVTIRDTGEGISQEHLERIAEQFYKANPNRGGSGLGLAITKRIVELHEGKLSIDSELGKGTAVSVLLPFKKGANHETI